MNKQKEFHVNQTVRVDTTYPMESNLLEDDIDDFVKTYHEACLDYRPRDMIGKIIKVEHWEDSDSYLIEGKYFCKYCEKEHYCRAIFYSSELFLRFTENSFKEDIQRV